MGLATQNVTRWQTPHAIVYGWCIQLFDRRHGEGRSAKARLTDKMLCAFRTTTTKHINSTGAGSAQCLRFSIEGGHIACRRFAPNGIAGGVVTYYPCKKMCLLDAYKKPRCYNQQSRQVYVYDVYCSSCSCVVVQLICYAYTNYLERRKIYRAINKMK